MTSKGMMKLRTLDAKILFKRYSALDGLVEDDEQPNGSAGD